MPVSPADYKQALGRFASGVTVVTVEVDGRVHGMTVSAFASVSLDPPLILVSIAKKAEMLPLLSGAQRFSVTILAADQKALSNHFAGYGEAEVGWERLDGLPVVAGGLAALACATTAVHDAGDHVLFVGEVAAVSVTDRDPLTYYRGNYRSLVTLP